MKSVVINVAYEDEEYQGTNDAALRDSTDYWAGGWDRAINDDWLFPVG